MANLGMLEAPIGEVEASGGGLSFIMANTSTYHSGWRRNPSTGTRKEDWALFFNGVGEKRSELAKSGSYRESPEETCDVFEGHGLVNPRPLFIYLAGYPRVYVALIILDELRDFAR